MHMLYNSPSFIVVQFEIPVDTVLAQDAQHPPLNRGGFEIVDKFTRKEIFIEGALAQQFQEGVEAMMETDPSEEDFDDFIEPYALMGQQTVIMH